MQKIGTTNRGIGFAYVDKDRSRGGADGRPDRTPTGCRPGLMRRPARRRPYDLGGDPTRTDMPFTSMSMWRLKAPQGPCDRCLAEINIAILEEKSVLVEGAQGAFLDVIHGTQKFVTSG